MSSLAFSCLSYFGFRNYLIELYAFNPPKPSYTLRKKQPQDLDSIDSAKKSNLDRKISVISSTLQNIVFDQDNNRLHYVSSALKSRTDGKQSVDHQRISLRQSIATHLSVIRKESVETRFKKEEMFPSNSYQEERSNHLMNKQKMKLIFIIPRFRSLSHMDIYNQSALKNQIIQEVEESHSNNQFTFNQTKSNKFIDCGQQYEILLINFEDKMVYELPKLEKLEVIGYYLTTASNKVIASVYVNYIEQPSDMVILYSHGNSCDIGFSLDTLLDLAFNLRVNVFAYEYTGYGQSSGKKNDIEIIKCIQSAYNFLITMGFKWNQIILYGYSIGSGPTITLVIFFIYILSVKASLQNYPVRGIILHSPIASGLRTVLGDYEKTIYYDLFPNVDLIPFIRAPILLIHGLLDNVVPFISAQLLKQKIRKLFLFWVVEKGDHYNIDIHNELRPHYFSQLRSFFESFRTYIFKSDILALPWNQIQLNHFYYHHFKSQDDVTISTKNSESQNQKEIQMRDSRQQQSFDSLTPRFCE